MFCEQCGTKLEEDAVFCPNCGAKAAGMAYDDKTIVISEEPSALDLAKQAEAEAASEPAETAESTEAEAAPAETMEAEAESAETAEREPAAAAETEAVEAETAAPASTVAEMGGQKIFCPNCGAANGTDDLFCQRCGGKLGGTVGGTNYVNGSGKDGKQKKGQIIAVAAVAGVAVLVIGILIVSRIVGGSSAKEKDFIMYVKDNELTMARKNKYEPTAVGGRLFDDEDNAASGYIGDLLQYSADHKYVFYPQKIDMDGCDLYRKKLGSNKAEEVKIDSRVLQYELVDDDRLVYVKDTSDRNLYLYRKDQSEKIASDVWEVHVSADGKFILWRDEDSRLYVQDMDLKTAKVKLESDVSQICDFSADFDVIVYQKEDKLYVMKGMKEKEKVASDVSSAYVYHIDDDLKMYYLKEGDQDSLGYYDLIEDDLLEQDQKMTEPNIEDYKKVSYEETFWGIMENVEVDEAYYDEVDKYDQKQYRDNLRTMLKDDELALDTYDIYYYDDSTGDSSKVLTTLNQQGVVICGKAAANDAMLYVYNIDQERIKGPKLSSIEMGGYYDMQQEVARQIGKSGQLLYLDNGELHTIEDYEAGENTYGIYLNVWGNEEKHTFYIQDYDGEDSRLYSYDYGKKDASLELITDELMGVVSYDMDEICYFNADDELYYGDDMIAEECAGIGRACGDESILYFADMDKNGEEGTLYLYQNGKEKKIADDVAPMGGYEVFDSDKIVFLSDYNFKKYRGDLNLYDGKKIEKIDSDVTRILY